MDNISLWQSLLGWCSLINMGVLLWWWLFFSLAHDWVYQLHTRWFRIEPESFDRIHYCGMAIFKLAIFMFNLVPYISLRIIQ